MDWRVLAGGQGGVVRFQQLLGAGVTRHQLDRLLARGELVRLARGIYGLPGPTHPWLRELRTTMLGAGPGAVVWRRSAAAWWGLDGFDREVAVEVAVGPGGRRGDERVSRLRGRASLLTTVARGLEVTTVGQTLLDLGTVYGPDLVERGLEDGLRRRLVDLGSLQVLVARAPRARSGAGVLRQVLRRRPPGAPPTESDAETLFVQLTRRGGLPDPVRQLPLVVRGRPVRLDFAWPAWWRAVEIDGARFHGEGRRGHDLRRQNDIVLAGWRLLRFTWQDVALYPDETIGKLGDWFS